MEPLFSIITVCKNEKNRICKTLESVSRQVFRDFEFIVIDGNSTDGTIEKIKKFRELIKVFISENDNGVYSAQNKGIRNASGKFLLFLNGGDYLSNEVVLKNVAGAKISADINYGDLILISEDGEKEISYKEFLPDANTLWTRTFPHPCTFIRKSLFERIGHYDEKLKVAGDYDFFLRAIFRYQAETSYIPSPISCFYTDGISWNPRFQQLRKTEINLSRKRNFPKTFYIKRRFSELFQEWEKMSRKHLKDLSWARRTFKLMVGLHAF